MVDWHHKMLSLDSVSRLKIAISTVWLKPEISPTTIKKTQFVHLHARSCDDDDLMLSFVPMLAAVKGCALFNALFHPLAAVHNRLNRHRMCSTTLSSLTSPFTKTHFLPSRLFCPAVLPSHNVTRVTSSHHELASSPFRCNIAAIDSPT